MKKRLVLIYTLLFFIALPLFAQKIRITSIEFNANKKPNGSICGMAEDQKGNIWMADLYQGFFKYDGTNLTHFPSLPSNPNTPSSQRLECVLVDKDNYIWIGNFSNGLDRYDPESETFVHFNHNPNDSTSIRSNAIRAMVEDKEGNIWIGTERGLDKYDVKTKTFVHVHNNSSAADLLATEHIRKLYIDQQGMLWIGCSSPFANESTIGGLFQFNPITQELIHYLHEPNNPHSLIDNRVRAIYEDSRGTFWVGTAGDGLHTLDINTRKFTRHSFDPDQPEKLSRSPVQNNLLYAADHITFIQEDNEGFIWIGTFEGGLSRYNPITKKVIQIVEKKDGQNLTQNMWSVLKTQDGLLWMALWGSDTGPDAALLKINTQPQQLERIALEGLGRIRGFEENNKGALYFGGIRGLQKRKGNRQIQTIFNFPTDIPVRLGVIDLTWVEQQLWCGTGNGLYGYNEATQELQHFLIQNDTIPTNAIYKVISLGNDELLLATDNGVVLLNTTTKKIKAYPLVVDNNYEFGAAVFSIFALSEKRILVGVDNFGLKELNLETGRYNDKPYGLGVYTVNDFLEDSQGDIWMVTNLNGLGKWEKKTEQFTKYIAPENHLYENSTIYNITEGKDSTLWLLSTQGIINLNPRTGESLLIGESWGLDLFSLTQYKGSYTSKQGAIYFADENGYFVVHPDELVREHFTTAIPYVNKLYLNGKLIHPDNSTVLEQRLYDTKKIDLAHHQNNLAFEIGYTEYLINNSDEQLQYRLTNFDDTWQNTQSGGRVIFPNLAAGAYQLELKANDLTGKWNHKTLQINIALPWWRTWWAYLGYTLVFSFLFWRIHLFQKERLLKAERERNQEKELVQAKEIEKAYHELKNTQAQLVHAEKMASLGELTAGIAHEIQNPLNFVNNFAEVSQELLEEMEEEIEKGDTEEVKAIAKDVISNLGKIHHHGQRADSIVKNMLQHSRSSSGEKALTDINKLADEYLRLAYHGVRAKDKSFNATMKTDFDENIGKIEVISQDIGRVVLNLITNAFYAVNEKHQQSNGTPYMPEVIVRTQKFGDTIKIQVKDNGNGIPDKVLNKIFQPFFTTKPTGEGTGLGLSMSYDIVTKGHGGTLEVETEEGVGTSFMISLPIITG